MHESQLARSTYTEGQITTDAETGTSDSGTFFQDCEVSPTTLSDGTLKQRFDPIAYPQKGVAYTGTDDDGNAVPLPPVAMKDNEY